MSIFSEVAFHWNGEEYAVPADKVMGLIEVVEDVITLEELSNQTKGVKRAVISKAFAVALRYAGANASQQDVYTAFFDASRAIDIQTAITALLMMMIPPEHLQSKGKTETKKTQADSAS